MRTTYKNSGASTRVSNASCVFIKLFRRVSRFALNYDNNERLRIWHSQRMKHRHVLDERIFSSFHMSVCKCLLGNHYYTEDIVGEATQIFKWTLGQTKRYSYSPSFKSTKLMKKPFFVFKSFHRSVFVPTTESRCYKMYCTSWHVPYTMWVNDQVNNNHATKNEDSSIRPSLIRYCSCKLCLYIC